MRDPDLLARLADARGFVFDLDGTLVLGDRRGHGLRPLPGAVEITSWAAARGRPFVVFTNGTTRTPARLAGIMREIGFGLPDEAMMTPASSAVRVLGREGHQRVMALGGAGLTEPLAEAGFEVVPPEPGTTADAVLVGWFPEFTMPALEAACHAVWSGAELYSASDTPFFAVDGGRALGTSRAISAMIKSLTGCAVRVVGKPSLDALRSAAERLGPARPTWPWWATTPSSRCRWRTGAGHWPSRSAPAWAGGAPTTACPPRAGRTCTYGVSTSCW